MNRPTPAIVAQDAVRRLPRPALLSLCAVYVLAGFIGREPWRGADAASFGYMLALAQGQSDWLAPTLLGLAPETDGPLAYWLGALAILALQPLGVPADFAARVPSGLLLALTLAASWWGVYFLARGRQAQPVPFAFGGEARPTDYARALADAGLLALLACLGLAQLSHETTPSVAQLGAAALAFCALAALPGRAGWPPVALVVALVALAAGGAPTIGLLMALAAALVFTLDRDPQDWPAGPARVRIALVLLAALTALLAAAALGTWAWRAGAGPRDWASLVRLLVWFTWPAWPLALWTLWRWRRQLRSRHVALPLGLLAVSLAAMVAGPNPDRALLLGLPALAALAAFALPTLQRSVSALIDWFTLLFFSTCALTIWVVWISLQTGVPPKPAANVARLAPGFEPSFSVLAFALAVAGTVAWGALVRWRVGRNRSALWKSLVLPAGGAVLCWLLVMTLWLPVLDYARSFLPVVRGLQQAVDRPGCVQVLGLSRAQIAALRFHAGWSLEPAGAAARCPWLVVSGEALAGASGVAPARVPDGAELVRVVRRPTDARDTLHLYRMAP